MWRMLPRFSRRWLFIAACALPLICAFEVTTRLLPPDGMTETVTFVGNTSALQSPIKAATFTEPRDNATITHVYMALNNGTITPPYLLSVGAPSCNLNGPISTIKTEITFTWHGLPTQVWYQENCSDWSRTSGGLPDLWERAPTAKLGV